MENSSKQQSVKNVEAISKKFHGRKMQNVDSRMENLRAKPLSQPYSDDFGNERSKIDNESPKIELYSYYKSQSLENVLLFSDSSLFNPTIRQPSVKSIKATSTKSRGRKMQKIDSKMKNLGAKQLSEPYSDLANVQPKIDNKPPKIELDTYYKPQSLEAEGQAVMEIDRQNLELLKKLNTIHRLGGKTDCWNLEWNHKPPSGEKQSEVERIMNENKALLSKIEQATGLYCTADLMREWRSREAAKTTKDATSESSKPIGKKSKKEKKKISPSRTIIDSARPRCYFEIEEASNHRKFGKIVFQLFADIVPKTCENFQSFCRGFNGLSYKGTPFHRILPGYWCQGGDVTKYNGSGGTSIYGDTFDDENFQMQHSEPGILSTCSYGKNMNNSKFNLTFERLETMNGKKVVFGKVIGGLSTLREIERFGTMSGRPIAKIIVSNCGIL